MLNQQLNLLMDAFQKFKEMYRKIDGCPTRDALYQMYHDYTDDMEDASGDQLDELWDLRDRVVVRLALFDLYGKALKEAKSADVSDI